MERKKIFNRIGDTNVRILEPTGRSSCLTEKDKIKTTDLAAEMINAEDERAIEAIASRIISNAGRNKKIDLNMRGLNNARDIFNSAVGKGLIDTDDIITYEAMANFIRNFCESSRLKPYTRAKMVLRQLEKDGVLISKKVCITNEENYRDTTTVTGYFLVADDDF